MLNPITFSTLACPQWPAEAVIARASEFGYDGLEWRGGPQGHIHPDLSSSAIVTIRRAVLEAGLFSLAITAYTSFVSDSPAERRANVDELNRYADLAAEMGARYVRAFLGEAPATTTLPDAYGRIVECLALAAQYAATVGVTIAIEPHDSFVRSAAVAPILGRVAHPVLSVIWDIANAFSVGEEPAEGFEVLSQHLAYVQVKDGRGRGRHWQLTALGAGAVPLKLAFDLLRASGYTGALSVEWEYAWHPELDPPEVALPAALRFVKDLIAQ